MELREEEVVVVGAGIAGLATALALKRVGIQALVLERSEGLRATGAALSLFPNAWLALEALGVAHKLTSIYAPITKGYITNVANGAVQEVSYKAPTRNEIGPRGVHRKALLEALAEELPADAIRFSSKLTSIEIKTQGGASIAIIHLEDGAVIKAKVLIGCDGVHSVVAHWLGLKPPVSCNRWAVRGLAVHPEGHGFNHEPHQYVDVGKRAGVVPLTDQETYWFIGCEHTSRGEDMAKDPKLIQKTVLENLAKDFPLSFTDVVRHSDLSTLTWAQLVLRYPWEMITGTFNKANVTLAGDAMHPMSPDLGQGGCAALEDAIILARHIGESFTRHGKLVPEKVAGALESYVKERRWRAASLITASYVAGRAQQDGSGWFMKFIRDVVFYKLFYNWIFSVTHYDCGKLPNVPSAHDSNDTTENKLD